MVGWIDQQRPAVQGMRRAFIERRMGVEKDFQSRTR